MNTQHWHRVPLWATEIDGAPVDRRRATCDLLRRWHIGDVPKLRELMRAWGWSHDRVHALAKDVWEWAGAAGASRPPSPLPTGRTKAHTCRTSVAQSSHTDRTPIAQEPHTDRTPEPTLEADNQEATAQSSHTDRTPIAQEPHNHRTIIAQSSHIPRARLSLETEEDQISDKIYFAGEGEQPSQAPPPPEPPPVTGDWRDHVRSPDEKARLVGELWADEQEKEIAVEVEAQVFLSTMDQVNHTTSKAIPIDQEWEMDATPLDYLSFDTATPLTAPLVAAQPLAPKPSPEPPDCPPVHKLKPSDRIRQIISKGATAPPSGPEKITPPAPPPVTPSEPEEDLSAPMLPPNMDLMNLLSSRPNGGDAPSTLHASSWIRALVAAGISSPYRLESLTFDDVKFIKGIGPAIAKTIDEQMQAWGSSLAPDPEARMDQLIRLAGRHSSAPASLTRRDRRWLKGAELSWLSLRKATSFDIPNLKKRFSEASRSSK